MRVTHGACGKAWEQRGNKSGHCSACHETYYGITAFDAHQHRDTEGRITCRRDTTTSTGRPVPWWQDDDGQWHLGERMTDEQKRKAGWVTGRSSDVMCDCGHRDIQHHGVDPSDGCMAVTLPPYCPCNLTCTEVRVRVNPIHTGGAA